MQKPLDVEETAGWRKSLHNPVLGGTLGTCFDITMLKEGDLYRMWFSWRPQKSIALSESTDGISWSTPQIVLGPDEQTGWEDDLNRPGILKKDGVYHLWYTGQAQGKSWIGYARSSDGIQWQRCSPKPVLSAEESWEGVAVMCPHVVWDEPEQLYKLWYSGGEQYEPDALGYATSRDGLSWQKHVANPIFTADPRWPWEQDKVTGAQVVPYQGWYLLFYIGFEDVDHARIGLARSRDGITHWERHPANPLLQPSSDPSSWDYDATYKPFVLHESGRWLLWYNGRNASSEQIGLAIHEGDDLGFTS